MKCGLQSWLSSFPHLFEHVIITTSLREHLNTICHQVKYKDCKYLVAYCCLSISVAARSKAAARLLGLRVRIPLGGMDVSLMSVACCKVVVYASGWSLVQRGPTECGVSKCGWVTSLWPTWGCRGMEGRQEQDIRPNRHLINNSLNLPVSP